MRPALLTWHRLRWPREVTPEQVADACRLLATTAGWPVVLEAVGSSGLVEHRLALPEGRSASVVDQLRAAIPGLAVAKATTRPPLVATHAVSLRLSTRRRPLRTDDPVGVTRAVLTALADVRRGERLVIQWMLGRPLRPLVVPNHLEGLGRESWLGALLLAPLGPPPPADAETRHALREKQGEPGWQAAVRVGVMAASPGRERQLIRQVLGAIRSAEAPGVGFAVHVTRAAWVNRARVPRFFWPLRVNAHELAALSVWPLGMTNELPVKMIGSRLVAPSAAIPRRGRIIGRATFPGRERALALTSTDSLRHRACAWADRRWQVHLAPQSHNSGHGRRTGGGRD